MKKEKSCGAIVYRLDGDNILVLMVKHINGGHWSFPKGHVEQNETEAQTAKREIMEETGINVEIDTRFKEKVTYSPKKDVLKDVIFFAAKTEEKEYIRQQEEISKIEWVNLTDAEKKVAFENDRMMIKNFIKYITNHAEYERNI
ncbi:MAG: NUDIX domain-containing protein [Ruminococcaceae bacterium]|nr:NUDIX domain-containing protein [Oscillospiraceae bacterium]